VCVLNYHTKIVLNYHTKITLNSGGRVVGSSLSTVDTRAARTRSSNRQRQTGSESGSGESESGDGSSEASESESDGAADEEDGWEEAEYQPSAYTAGMFAGLPGATSFRGR
jgi:hypothetical protein